MPKSKRQQAADAAWERTNQLAMEMPALAPEPPALPLYHRVPAACPECQRPMSVQHGWALVFGDILQCGFCAHRIQVPRNVWAHYSTQLHAFFTRK